MQSAPAKNWQESYEEGHSLLWRRCCDHCTQCLYFGCLDFEKIGKQCKDFFTHVIWVENIEPVIMVWHCSNSVCSIANQWKFVMISDLPVTIKLDPLFTRTYVLTNSEIFQNSLNLAANSENFSSEFPACRRLQVLFCGFYLGRDKISVKQIQRRLNLRCQHR